MRTILTLNAGSSSLKFALFGLIDVHQGQLIGGQIATDGSGGARFLVRECTGDVLVDRRYAMPSGVIDADRAIEILLHWLSAAVPKLQLSAVGHRVVHGGRVSRAPSRSTTTWSPS
jgi:acetate kinase